MMQERNRESRELPAPAAGGTGGIGLVQTEAERLLALSADVIERALSKDSASFLASTRQQGGQ
jgi:hypothetical protein